MTRTTSLCPRPLSLLLCLGLLLCAVVAAAPATARAESIRSGGMFGIGLGGGTSTTGVSMKYWMSNSQALQGVIGIWGLGRDHGTVVALSGDYLFELPSLTRNSVIDLGWNIGVGPFLGIGDATWLGASGVLGLEFNFVAVPIDITIEYRPGLLIIPAVDADLIAFTGHIRYFF
jgi:hypothetical protein